MVGVGAMAVVAASVTESRTIMWYDVVMRGGVCASKSKSYKVVVIYDNYIFRLCLGPKFMIPHKPGQYLIRSPN